MKEAIINKAIEVYIEKLERENANMRQELYEINEATGWDSSRPDRTTENKYSEIVDILRCYERVNEGAT